jgi:hypothetical protein
MQPARDEQQQDSNKQYSNNDLVSTVAHGSMRVTHTNEAPVLCLLSIISHA